MITATQNKHYNVHEPVLFMAFELSEKSGSSASPLAMVNPYGLLTRL